MFKLRSSVAISPELVVMLALLYYGFSLYVDVNVYNVTELGIFLNHQTDYFPSLLYFYSWIIPTACVTVFLLLFPRRNISLLPREMSSNQDKSTKLLAAGYLLYFFIVFVIIPSAQNRAGVFLAINEDYSLISWLLPVTVWCSCFVILGARSTQILIAAVFLNLLISLTLVDRSYLIMGVIACAVRVGNIHLVKLALGAIILFVIFTFWKVVLFWVVFDVDIARSLENVQFGVARFEAITSQSIFVNCLEFERCSSIDVSSFIFSTIDRIMPSFIYDAGLPYTQEIYIDQFFHEIAARGGGLGFSLVTEFSLVFGVIMGPWMLTVYIFCLLLLLRFGNSMFFNFIFTIYFLRFLRVDLGTGIKGIFVFGFLSLIVYFLFTSVSYYRKRQYG